MDKQKKTRIFTLSIIFVPLFLFIGFSTHALRSKDSERISTHNSEILDIIPLDSFEKTPKKTFLSEISKQKKILVFWSSRCVTCRLDWHNLALYTKNKNTDFIGVNVTDSFPQIQHFLKTNPNPFGYLFMDQQGNILTRLGFVGVPALLIADENNQIIYRYNGRWSKNMYHTIKTHLK